MGSPAEAAWQPFSPTVLTASVRAAALQVRQTLLTAPVSSLSHLHAHPWLVVPSPFLSEDKPSFSPGFPAAPASLISTLYSDVEAFICIRRLSARILFLSAKGGALVSLVLQQKIKWQCCLFGVPAWDPSSFNEVWLLCFHCRSSMCEPCWPSPCMALGQ